MIEYRRFGYDFSSDDDKECFDNIFLLYDSGELYWITCTDDALDGYFEDEIFVMGFSLQKRRDYSMIFATNIKYEDMISDLRMNKINRKVKVLFSEEEYNKYRKFKITGNTFSDVVLQLEKVLSVFRMDSV